MSKWNVECRRTSLKCNYVGRTPLEIFATCRMSPIRQTKIIYYNMLYGWWARIIKASLTKLQIIWIISFDQLKTHTILFSIIIISTLGKSIILLLYRTYMEIIRHYMSIVLTRYKITLYLILYLYYNIMDILKYPSR